MVIKKLIAVLLIVIVFMVTGCSNTTNNPIQQTQDDITVWVDVEPVFNDNQINTYRVVCNIFRQSADERSEEFNDAVITVNDLALTLSDDFNGYFVYKGENLKLQVGDSVKIVVIHSSFAKIEDTLTVPPATSNLNVLSEEIDQYVSGSIDSITLNWDDVDSTGYKAWIYRYYSPDMSYWMSGTGVYVTSNSHTFTNSDLYDDKLRKADAVEFKIIAVNKNKYEAAFGQVDFEVVAPSGPSKSNVTQ